MTGARGGLWRVGDGEEARLTLRGAEIRSRGTLPLRLRSAGRPGLKAEFPGTAVVLGDRAYEVLSEMELVEEGVVLYRLRPWPDGEVVRDRVQYSPTFVRAAEEQRTRGRTRARARPFRWLLYPLVGLLPEDAQERLCDRLGLYSVTATLVSGLAEGLGVLLLLAQIGRGTGDPGQSIVFVTVLPGLVLFVLPGLGRAASAALLQETGGAFWVVAAVDVARRLGAIRDRWDHTLVPLTRTAFWARLGRPDTVTAGEGGSLVYRGLLPHVSWSRARRLESGGSFWDAEPLPAERRGARLVYAYRLLPLSAEPEARPLPPRPTAYGEEVLEGVRREWDDFNRAFSGLTCLLGAEVQARAFDAHGGPAAARRPTLVTATAEAGLGLYLLSFLPGVTGDPLAPFMGALALTLVADSARRVSAARAGRYAPSLLRFLLPSDVLRPERLAFHAHRDAERAALAELSGTGSPSGAHEP